MNTWLVTYSGTSTKRLYSTLINRKDANLGRDMSEIPCLSKHKDPVCVCVCMYMYVSMSAFVRVSLYVCLYVLCECVRNLKLRTCENEESKRVCARTRETESPCMCTCNIT